MRGFYIFHNRVVTDSWRKNEEALAGFSPALSPLVLKTSHKSGIIACVFPSCRPIYRGIGHQLRICRGHVCQGSIEAFVQEPLFFSYLWRNEETVEEIMGALNYRR